MDVHNRNWIMAHQIVPFSKDVSVLDIGSYVVSGQESIQCRVTIQPLVKEYVGVDMRPGPGVDIVANATSIPIPDNSFDVVISLDMIEHAEWPRDVCKEAYRVTKKGGVFYLSSVFDFPIHDYPSDYWRFTPNCIRLLLEDAGFQVVSIEGDGLKPGIVRGIGVKK